MIRLDHARAEDFLPTLKSDSCNLAILDPPYHRVLDESWDRQWKTAADYLAWLGSPILDEVRRVLAPNGSLYVCQGPALAARVEVEVIRPRFRVLNRIRWLKDEGWHNKAKKEDLRAYLSPWEEIIFAEQHGADSMAMGEAGYAAQCEELRGFVFEPLREYLLQERDRAEFTTGQVDAAWQTRRRSKGCMAGHWFGSTQWALPTAENYAWLRALFNGGESGEYLRKDYEYLRKDYEELQREYEELRRPFAVSADVPCSDVWTYPTVPPHPDRHEAEKPLEMLCDVIRASSRPGDLVLDCFAGRATTAAACVDTGRDFIGCEMDPGWHTAGLDRIEKHRAIRDRRPVEGRRKAGAVTGPLFRDPPC